MKLSRAQRLLEVIREHTAAFDLENPRESLLPLCIPALAEHTGISGNNVSMELSRLHREGALLRVGGRPVAYLSLPELEERLGAPLPATQFASGDELAAFLMPGEGGKAKKPAPPQAGRGMRVDCASQFDRLLGAEDSLAEHIRQAKAAITYPPNGLHTLFTGGTGTGKSLFANCMYDYAVQSGVLAADAAIVTFDCAHYSENPQLVLSQLFGYKKGSFTGADKDHPGLVEHADGGILFLDEIHRLTPEGQEKMFVLMDNGTFRRLGETSGQRQTKVLVVGATTEDPQNIMLNTFMRRIPVHITLPDLEKRTVRERLRLILFFIWRESRNIRSGITLDTEVLSMLLHYKCPANVGQLASDIRLTCANAYYDYQIGRSVRVHIRLEHLGGRIKEGLFTLSGHATGDSMLLQQMLKDVAVPVYINGGVEVDTLYRRYLVD